MLFYVYDLEEYTVVNFYFDFDLFQVKVFTQEGWLLQLMKVTFNMKRLINLQTVFRSYWWAINQKVVDLVLKIYQKDHLWN